MLHLQMLIPSLKTDASFTATLNMNKDVLMDLETVINLSETSYQQKALLKYGQPTLRSSTPKTVLGHSFIPLFAGEF